MKDQLMKRMTARRKKVCMPCQRKSWRRWSTKTTPAWRFQSSRRPLCFTKRWTVLSLTTKMQNPLPIISILKNARRPTQYQSGSRAVKMTTRSCSQLIKNATRHLSRWSRTHLTTQWSPIPMLNHQRPPLRPQRMCHSKKPLTPRLWKTLRLPSRTSILRTI